MDEKKCVACDATLVDDDKCAEHCNGCCKCEADGAGGESETMNVPESMSGDAGGATPAEESTDSNSSDGGTDTPAEGGGEEKQAM